MTKEQNTSGGYAAGVPKTFTPLSEDERRDHFRAKVVMIIGGILCTSIACAVALWLLGAV